MHFIGLVYLLASLFLGFYPLFISFSNIYFLCLWYPIMLVCIFIRFIYVEEVCYFSTATIYSSFKYCYICKFILLYAYYSFLLCLCWPEYQYLWIIDLVCQKYDYLASDVSNCTYYQKYIWWLCKIVTTSEASFFSAIYFV